MKDIVWQILGATSVILLIIFWQGPNAVWGGLTLGIIIGIIGTIVSVLTGKGFSLVFIGKSLIAMVMLGFGAEILGEIGNFIGKKTRG